MASLRARVLASMLVLAAVGLILAAAVTYAEQRSFLLDRVDEDVKAAGPAVSQIFDRKKLTPEEGSSAATGGASPDIGAPPGGDGDDKGAADAYGNLGAGHGAPNLPPGTYGERRSSSGKVLGKELISFGQAKPPAPKLPGHIQLNRLLTVGSVGSSGLRYRVIATRDAEDSGVTIVAVPLHDADQTLHRLLVVEGFVIVGVLIALGLCGFFVVRLGLRPLDRIETTAGEIAAGQLSRRVSPTDSRTEVGRLGLALNRMLERLERAFAERTESEERLRRFLADASHELRTPLASIRGYAELFRMGATRDEAGTTMAMRRIEDESKRMGVLVEDLLTLARLDEHPGFVHEQLDMSLLARDAVEDARATAPDREISLRAPAAATLAGDGARLRQVLANLMRNALVHTPAGTAIEVGVSQDAEHVTLTVRDHGPGLPADAAEQMFERFWRTEGGRERGKAGAGLGLAIALGIVQAHEGEIGASNAPGGGAEFVVRLPRSEPWTHS